MEVLLLIDREFTCRPRSGLLTDKYQVPSNSTVHTSIYPSIHLFQPKKEMIKFMYCQMCFSTATHTVHTNVYTAQTSFLVHRLFYFLPVRVLY